MPSNFAQHFSKNYLGNSPGETVLNLSWNYIKSLKFHGMCKSGIGKIDASSSVQTASEDAAVPFERK